ncbi:MAG: hypothetical protein OEZ01_10600 [Candidatus Heimdallarchaeota archaeon]|nr:hypothetical protein [Candidatus Heimdallarchaeota archaeon]
MLHGTKNIYSSLNEINQEILSLIQKMDLQREKIENLNKASEEAQTNQGHLELKFDELKAEQKKLERERYNQNIKRFGAIRHQPIPPIRSEQQPTPPIRSSISVGGKPKVNKADQRVEKINGLREEIAGLLEQRLLLEQNTQKFVVVSDEQLKILVLGRNFDSILKLERNR